MLCLGQRCIVHAVNTELIGTVHKILGESKVIIAFDYVSWFVAEMDVENVITALESVQVFQTGTKVNFIHIPTTIFEVVRCESSKIVIQNNDWQNGTEIHCDSSSISKHAAVQLPSGWIHPPTCTLDQLNYPLLGLSSSQEDEKLFQVPSLGGTDYPLVMKQGPQDQVSIQPSLKRKRICSSSSQAQAQDQAQDQTGERRTKQRNMADMSEADLNEIKENQERTMLLIKRLMAYFVVFMRQQQRSKTYY